MLDAVHYVPILTTLIAAIFALRLLHRYRERPSATHYLWWAGGVAVYGLGTFTEAITTLFGWHAPVFRAWYITGALLGGAPLAQGSVYLHLARRTANRLTVALVAVVAVAATCVILSPLDLSKVEVHRLSGAVLAWHWVRYFSPFINLYAVIFLIGGAMISAWRYRRRRETHHRFVGNVLIAVGATLPGFGGAATRFGHVEVLYVTELLGLILIWMGYRLNITPPSPVGGSRTPFLVTTTSVPALGPSHARELEERGFVVIPGPLPPAQFPSVVQAYDQAVADATTADVKHGTTTTKVTDFVTRGPAFDPLYVFPPLLDAAARVIGGPFQLSTLMARTLRSGAHAQELHVDVARETADWPLLGFLLMIDEFRSDNGGTQFVPGSHRWSDPPPTSQTGSAERVVASGPAGALLIFDGSTWHGHGPNTSGAPRRSIQGVLSPVLVGQVPTSALGWTMGRGRGSGRSPERSWLSSRLTRANHLVKLASSAIGLCGPEDPPDVGPSACAAAPWSAAYAGSLGRHVGRPMRPNPV